MTCIGPKKQCEHLFGFYGNWKKNNTLALGGNGN